MNTGLFVGIYQELLRAWPNRWIGFVLAVLVASVAALVVIALPDAYTSTARLYINSDIVLKPLLRGLTVEQSSEGASVDTQMLRAFQQMLLNDRNIDALVRTPGIGFDTSTPGGLSKAARIIRSGVTVVEDGPNLFSLTVVDSDGARAYKTADRLVTIFVQNSLKNTQSDLQLATGFLDDQIAQYVSKLRQLETQIADYQYKNVGALAEVNYQTRLKTALNAVRDAQLAQRVAFEMRARIRTSLASAAGAKTTPILIASDQTFPALIDRMGALQAQLNQLLLQYTDKHPDVIATRREIALLSEQYGLADNLGAVAAPFSALPGQVPPGSAINSAADQIAGTNVASGPTNVTGPTKVNASQSASLSSAQTQLLQANFAVMDADRKLASAEEGLKAIQQYSTAAPAAEAGLDQLNRDYTILKDNYEQLLRRRESARIMNAADLSSGSEQFRIVQSPFQPTGPSGPDRRTFLLLAAALSVAAGAALSYALGLLRGTFISATEAESILGLPVIAQLTNRRGVLSQVSRSADAFVLLGGVIAVFLGALILSSLSDALLSPVRGEIYHLLENVQSGRLF